MRFSKHVAIICYISVFLSPTILASEKLNTTDWKKLDYDVVFSIRCSKGPRETVFSNQKNYWYDFIYLKWDGEEITRLVYSTTVDAPHHWHNGEHGTTYRAIESGGKSKVEVDASSRVYEGEAIQSFKIDLDASKESELMKFMSDSVTFGTWTITTNNRGVSLKESTSIFYKDKLSSADSASWSSCRLMTPYGDQF